MVREVSHEADHDTDLRPRAGGGPGPEGEGVGEIVEQGGPRACPGRRRQPWRGKEEDAPRRIPCGACGRLDGSGSKRVRRGHPDLRRDRRRDVEVKLLIDTNVYALYRMEHAPPVATIAASDSVLVSPVVLGEILFGFRNGTRFDHNMSLLARFLEHEAVEVVPMGFRPAHRSP